MYVVPDARGSGLSRAILTALEDDAARLGARTSCSRPAIASMPLSA